MLRARDARSAAGPAGSSSGGSIRWRATVTGRMVGSLFLRAYERSERIYAAMQARGFEGTFRHLHARPLRRVEIGWLVAAPPVPRRVRARRAHLAAEAVTDPRRVTRPRPSTTPRRPRGAHGHAHLHAHEHAHGGSAPHAHPHVHEHEPTTGRAAGRPRDGRARARPLPLPGRVRGAARRRPARSRTARRSRWSGPTAPARARSCSSSTASLVPSHGDVRVAGLAVGKPTIREVRREVGLVFQDPDDQLFSPTVFDDVAFGPLHMGLGADEVHRRVEAALGLGRDDRLRPAGAAPDVARPAEAGRAGDRAVDGPVDPRVRRAVRRPRPARPARADRRCSGRSTRRCSSRPTTCASSRRCSRGRSSWTAA